MATNNNPDQKPSASWSAETPSAIDLHPKPEKVVRISWRAAALILSVILLLLLGFAYGAHLRSVGNQAAARSAGLARSIGPATQAASEFMQATPAGTVPLTLRPPNVPTQQSATPPCGSNPKTGKAYRFNPETGQPCDGRIQEHVAKRQPTAVRAQPVTPTSVPQETPEQRMIAAAYQQEQEAMLAPTSVRSPATPGLSPAFAQPALNDVSPVEALSRALGARQGGDAAAPGKGRGLENDYDGQNMQSWKEAFLTANHDRQAEDYLRSNRDAPLSPYEIKAGWEIPAVLEQSLNSDLPGELKALVRSNVYDTATGLYLLIPQGSRLVGRYDSRISYGQDGVQVVWNRIIYPDASSLDLDGMVGLDSHGNAGLRDKVDHHYRRLLGFSVLTSLFTAAFDISQRTNQSALTYPTPTQTAGSAVGQELSETGAEITRRNLNVQPTIKVPAGYKFVVRVNRDILFEAPYEPVQPDNSRN